MTMRFFHGTLRLDVPPGVYEPREDSLLLARVLERRPLTGMRCLDMGCGSGLLAMIMALRGGVVTAVDQDMTAVETTIRNAHANGLALDACWSDLFQNVRGTFDCIVFNAPYLPVAAHEPGDITYDGGPTGRRVIERFAAHVREHIAPHGSILLCISSLTGLEETIGLFTSRGFAAHLIAQEKVPWEELLVLEITR